MIDNFLSVPTDCPQRDERLGWTGDAQIFAGTAAYLSNPFAFMGKYMTDIRDSQSTDGNFDDRAPNNKCRKSPVGGWSESGIFIPYMMYKQSGDIAFLTENYEAMKKYADLLIRIFSSNEWIDVDIPGTFMQNTYGDWLAPEKTPCVLTETAFGAESFRRFAEIAGILGKHEDALYYQEAFAKTKEAWQREFSNKDGSTHCNPKKFGTTYWGNETHPDTGEVNTQCSYVVGLAFGLFDDSIAPLAAKRLKDAVVANDYHIQVGFLGANLILPVLTKFGYGETALRLLQEEGNPSWLYQVKNGATSIYEFWNGFKEENGKISYEGSMNHYSYGSATEWLFQSILGIRQITSGFQQIEIAPNLFNGLSHAEGFYDSVYGKISVNLSEEREMVLQVEIPANTSANLVFPKSGIWQETFSKKIYEVEADKLNIQLGSGKHRFVLSFHKSMLQ